MKIVGRAFSVAAFRAYVRELALGEWVPSLVVIHHCAAPSLQQRPKGFIREHMTNLAYYYGEEMGWSAGPHLFIDEDEIWVFSPLDRRGVHAASFNRTSWGIEMLGNFDVEDPTSGRGAMVLRTAGAAAAILLEKIGRTTRAIRFHRDDPKTKKTCPGRLVTRELFLAMVELDMQVPRPKT